MINGNAVQIKFPSTAEIAAQHEAAPVTKQRTSLIDPCPDHRHTWSTKIPPGKPPEGLIPP